MFIFTNKIKFNLKVPKSAYINVLDYKSPQDLANYLLYLDKNATAYNSYFKWKKHISFTHQLINPICSMCIQLHLESFIGYQNKVVANVEDFWNVKKDCKRFNAFTNSLSSL